MVLNEAAERGGDFGFFAVIFFRVVPVWIEALNAAGKVRDLVGQVIGHFAPNSRLRVAIVYGSPT
ncbi:hypothetical protein [Acidiphilium sp.]|uniref:hypothetical protein n=1 Tax=Acidiphilium sp. TaxID=527 RepID=UPI003CFF7E97